MRLDVVVPTYNRSASLERAVKSLLTSPIPEGNQVRVIVVDNRSTDATRSVVERLMNESSGRVLYVAENRNQGRSFALNAGIANATAELIGFIDDDGDRQGLVSGDLYGFFRSLGRFHRWTISSAVAYDSAGLAGSSAYALCYWMG